MNTELRELSASDIEKLVSAHDGDMALLFLYRHLHPSSSEEDAAAALCRTLGEIRAANEKLSRLVYTSSPASADAAAPSSVSVPKEEKPASAVSETRYLPDELQQYSKAEINQKAGSDKSFKAVIDEAQRVTGALLSENYLRVLYGVYDYLAMPAEVMLVLLNYCSERYSVENGGHGRLSARAFEKEAYHWYNNHIMSLEQAEEYISREHERWSELGKIKAVLNISGRNLTASETTYINSWLNMGFAADALSIAYDRTVTNTGSLKWAYMNKILLSWHEKKLHTAAEISSGDSHKKKPAVSGTQDSGPDISIEALRGLSDKI